MIRDEVFAAFPKDSTVRVRSTGKIAKVSGHATYLVAFIGERTMVELVSGPYDRILGEFEPSRIERIDNV